MPGRVIFRRAAMPLIAPVLLLGCESATTPAEPENSSAPEVPARYGLADGERLPLRGEYHTTNTALFAPADAGSEPRCDAEGLFTIVFEVEGRGSHLGRFTGTGSNCTAFPIPGPVPIQHGIFDVATANGDRLFGTYEGVQAEVDAEGAAVFETAVAIMGGTGRFTGATGMWEELGSISFVTGEVSATFDGWITYHAARRGP
ncbi:MAG TPA: hypothetical protein VMM83_07240 [Longimicrobiales bacterium]|nr:hypothetical protein [Longimicrobiales bacterium]